MSLRDDPLVYFSQIHSVTCGQTKSKQLKCDTEPHHYMRASRFIFLAVPFFAHISLARADIYIAYDAQGAPRYATQKLSGEYVLYLKEVVPSPPAHASLAQHRQTTDKALIARLQVLQPVIERTAKKYGLDPALVQAIAYVESRFQTTATSSAGAHGVMQLMPATATRYGVRNRSDAAQSIDGGARYIKDLLTQFDGNLALAVAAYNAGEGAVIKHARKLPPYRETMIYVPQVLAYYERYKVGQTP